MYVPSVTKRLNQVAGELELAEISSEGSLTTYDLARKYVWLLRLYKVLHPVRGFKLYRYGKVLKADLHQLGYANPEDSLL